jgi:hypothetical protein
MNNTTALPSFASRPTLTPPTAATFTSVAALDTLQSRVALRIASRLTERAEALGPDLGERLRFAREQALERARSVRVAAAETQAGVSAVGRTRGGAALLGRSGWWLKLASVLPVFALLGGLILIQQWQDNIQIAVAADIDAALLADDLPPTAYSDAGFAEFLKTPGE